MLRLGVEGKAAGWRTLRTLADTDRRLDAGHLDELISRASSQSAQLEEAPVRAVSRAISNPSAPGPLAPEHAADPKELPGGGEGRAAERSSRLRKRLAPAAAAARSRHGRRTC